MVGGGDAAAPPAARLGLNIGWSVVGSGGEKKVGKGEVDGGSGWWARGTVALAAG